MPDEIYDNEIIDEIREIQEGIAEDDSQLSETDGGKGSCPLCRHPARDLLTQVYYENDKSIESARQWFMNKFSRSYRESTWERHFHDHVDPFIQGHELVKKKKLNDLMERTAEAKREGNVSPVSMIKQMLFDFMLDAYVAKPTEMTTKQEKSDFSSMSKNLATLAKTYKDYQQMEMDILAYGKTEEEQKQVMANYMKGMIRDLMKLFEGNPEVQEKISSAFGIATISNNNPDIDIEIE